LNNPSNNSQNKQLTNYVGYIYDSLADTYEDDVVFGPLFYRFLYVDLDQIIKTMFHRGNKGPILDVGCGTGHFTLMLVEEGHYVIGVDLSLGSLKKAKNQAKALGAKNVDLVLASAVYLPFADALFEASLSIGSVINHLSKVNAELMISEISRVLLQKGLLVVDVDNVTSPDLLNHFVNPCDEFYAVDLRDVLRSIFSGFKFGFHYLWTYKGNTVKLYMYTYSELRRLLGRHRLTIEKTHASNILTSVLTPSFRMCKSNVTAEAVVKILHKIDNFLGNVPLFNKCGDSLLVISRKI
jgi:ubiquinone/menaquinone biosynthesis C-methylase UbiE